MSILISLTIIDYRKKILFRTLNDIHSSLMTSSTNAAPLAVIANATKIRYFMLDSGNVDSRLTENKVYKI